MSQERHAASTSQSKVFGLLNGHGFGLFPTGSGGRGAGGYATVSHHGLDEDEDVLGYRFGTRRGGRSRTLTGGVGRNISVRSRMRSRESLLTLPTVGIARVAEYPLNSSRHRLDIPPRPTLWQRTTPYTAKPTSTIPRPAIRLSTAHARARTRPPADKHGPFALPCSPGTSKSRPRRAQRITLRVWVEGYRTDGWQGG